MSVPSSATEICHRVPLGLDMIKDVSAGRVILRLRTSYAPVVAVPPLGMVLVKRGVMYSIPLGTVKTPLTVCHSVV